MPRPSRSLGWTMARQLGTGIDPDFVFASTNAAFKAGTSDKEQANSGVRIRHITPGTHSRARQKTNTG